MKFMHPAALTACIALSAASPLAAQIDYRNLDDDRPTAVEDAYAIERYAFEFLLPHLMTRSAGSATIHAFVPELAYGIASGMHVGLKLPVVNDAGPAGRRWGIGGLRAFALYNANTEGPFLPALSLRVDGFFPVGSSGGDVTRGEVKLIATRSFGRNRLHLNAAVGVGPDAAGPSVEGASRWWYGAAIDRALFRQSLLLIGEVYARRDAASAPMEVNTSVGLRWQWTTSAVLDIGVARRLRATGPDFAMTFGVSKAFGIAGLMPRGPARPTTPEAPDAHRH